MSMITKKSWFLCSMRAICGMLTTLLIFMQSVPIFAAEPFTPVSRFNAPIQVPKKEEKKKKKSAVLWDLVTNNFLVRKFRKDPYTTVLTIVTIVLTVKQLGITKKNPFARKPKVVKEQKPKLTLNDLGGNQELKNCWQLARASMDSYKELFAIGVKRQPKGILLVGPPGCGKTTFMQIVQSDPTVNTVCLKISEVLSKYVGESEKNVKDLLSEAYELAAKSKKPTVLFIDEAEALLGKRGRGDNRVYDGVLTTFLQEVAGVETKTGQPVFLILATNHEELIDPAAIRIGRIDRIIYMDLDKKAVFETLAKQYRLADQDVVQKLISEKNVFNRFENGAEIHGWLDDAGRHAVFDGRNEISVDDLMHCLPTERKKVANHSRRAGQLVESEGRIPVSYLPDN